FAPRKGRHRPQGGGLRGNGQKLRCPDLIVTRFPGRLKKIGLTQIAQGQGDRIGIVGGKSDQVEGSANTAVTWRGKSRRAARQIAARWDALPLVCRAGSRPSPESKLPCQPTSACRPVHSGNWQP